MGPVLGNRQFNVKVLVIVNESPWGSSLGVTALRLVRALIGNGERLSAIFFREEGVYHAQPGRVHDAATPCLHEAWQSLSADNGIPLLLCSSASQRRFEQVPSTRFQEAGLARLMELLQSSDRVVTF
jgi:tRNA 2-thiouridine synthesizing protein D